MSPLAILHRAYRLLDLATLGRLDADLLFSMREAARLRYRPNTHVWAAKCLLEKGADPNAKSIFPPGGANATDLSLVHGEHLAVWFLRQGGRVGEAGIELLHKRAAWLCNAYDTTEIAPGDFPQIARMTMESNPHSPGWYRTPRREKDRYTAAAQINFAVPGFSEQLILARQARGGSGLRPMPQPRRKDLADALVRTVRLMEIDCDDPISREERADRIPRLIEMGANPNFTTTHGRAMQHAIWQLDTDCVQMLLDGGARASARDLDRMIYRFSRGNINENGFIIEIPEEKIGAFYQVIGMCYDYRFDWDGVISILDWEDDPVDVQISTALGAYMDKILSAAQAEHMRDNTPIAAATAPTRRI